MLFLIDDVSWLAIPEADTRVGVVTGSWCTPPIMHVVNYWSHGSLFDLFLKETRLLMIWPLTWPFQEQTLGWGVQRNLCSETTPPNFYLSQWFMCFLMCGQSKINPYLGKLLLLYWYNKGRGMYCPVCKRTLAANQICRPCSGSSGFHLTVWVILYHMIINKMC